MKKTTKKALCILLTVVLVAGVFPFSAFADGQELALISGKAKLTTPPSDFSDVNSGILSETPTGKRHLILGDSIAAGYGLDSYWEIRNATNQPTADTAVIPDTYGGIVSEAFGSIDDAVSRAHCAWRTTDFVNIVGHNTIGQSWIEQYFGRAMMQLTEEEALAEHEIIPAEIKKADYVTLNFGCNDMYTVALFELMDEAEFLLGDLELPDLDISGITSYKDLIDNVSKIVSLVGDINDVFALLYDCMEDGLRAMMKNYPEILDIVTSCNPDTQVFVMGLDNVLKITLDLPGGISSDLYTRLATYITRANIFLKNLCRDYANVTYVDIAGGPFFGISYILTDSDADIGNIGHPTADGHKYIADKLIKAIAPRFEKPVVTVSKNGIGQPVISWDKLDGAVSYRVYRSRDMISGYQLVCATPFTKCVDLTSDSDGYYYRVIAVKDLLGKTRTAPSAAQYASYDGFTFTGLGSDIADSLKSFVVKTYNSVLSLFTDHSFGNLKGVFGK